MFSSISRAHFRSAYSYGTSNYFISVFSVQFWEFHFQNIFLMLDAVLDFFFFKFSWFKRTSELQRYLHRHKRSTVFCIFFLFYFFVKCFTSVWHFLKQCQMWGKIIPAAESLRVLFILLRVHTHTPAKQLNSKAKRMKESQVVFKKWMCQKQQSYQGSTL